VIFFFMLTGYLFWGKARTVNGRMNTLKLWRGRLYRIAPLYLFSLLPVLIFVTVETGGQWLALQNWQPLARLFALGALSWQNIGSVSLNDYNAGVIWTLKYEWYFYLTLPFVAWLIIGRKIFGVTLTVYALILAGLWLDLNLLPGLFLILGALCSELLASQSLRVKLQGSTAAVTALLTSALLAVLRRQDLGAIIPTDSLGIVCLPIFVVAAAGNNFSGILTHPAMRCLGAISFSLYLLHGIAFHLVAHGLKAAGLTNLSSLECWGIFVASACVTTGICALTYRWIEFPFLSKSHKKPWRKNHQNTAGKSKAASAIETGSSVIGSS
jgi:peptidoglycan/LPS O-acetylase OafA/YrhL